MIFKGNIPGIFNDFKKAMAKEFEMTDIGEMPYFLEVEVKQMQDGIFISQKKHTEQIQNERLQVDSYSYRTIHEIKCKFNKRSNEPTLFKSIVGSIKYLTITQPDITYVIGLVSIFMEKPKQDHWIVAKRILRYVKGTMDHGLFYTHSEIRSWLVILIVIMEET
ncbi:uncharacterized mitochondrial protein AtMg00810-like [Hibiscus syriacus]|uniref:uncharacterized mitochondrial protein AtMg00810-like n=1 Tax=Hibiscus syriacus TaxID=106335 RepID=UPI001920FD6C|nr:uncharacterized mitochondrial protein AtMg00810-like [Hibiscus syriacus]